MSSDDVSIISYVENCLLAWADWHFDGSGRTRIGYAISTTEYKLMREGPGAGQATGRAEITMPSLVEMVEQAVVELPHRQREAIKLKYLRRYMSDRTRAKKLHISYSMFRRELDRARWFIGGKLL